MEKKPDTRGWCKPGYFYGKQTSNVTLTVQVYHNSTDQFIEGPTMDLTVDCSLCAKFKTSMLTV